MSGETEGPQETKRCVSCFWPIRHDGSCSARCVYEKARVRLVASAIGRFTKGGSK